ncbi:hypothetical protein DM01DRAFT_1090785 [Hesseltinella vesiculosa]|uniref:USP domain-containing protein n=1 Tax=Hesseltinella vesiculosa TaxID=101127 RepID=A0A1X2GCU0_9FUNG|nr:hypothetical protein DM01DRAFT_1090785 [Hesseltinella vesiculosa]
MNSFHACLDPLVYEKQKDWFDEDAYGSSDDDVPTDDDTQTDGHPRFKLTTFSQVPPLLLVLLEDRRSDNDTAAADYHIEPTVYLDRYLTANRQLVLEKHQQGDQWRQEVLDLRTRLDQLQKTLQSPASAPAGAPHAPASASSPSALSKTDILDLTSRFLNSKISSDHPSPDYTQGLQSLNLVVQNVKNNLERKQKEFAQLEQERQASLKGLFEDDTLKKRPYDLRAALYTDGMNGTGHHWGYIWIEPDEENLLEDIPIDNEGSWYRFCDADVRKVTSDEVVAESANPFALLYCDRTLPVVPKDQILSQVPSELTELIDRDNQVLEDEITAHSQPLSDRPISPYSNITDLGAYNVSSENSNTVSDTNVVVIPTQPPDYTPYDTNSAQDAIVIEHVQSVGPDPSPQVQPSPQHYDLAEDFIVSIRDCPGDDPRLLTSGFHMFLARVSDVDTMAKYIAAVDAHTEDPGDGSIPDLLRSKMHHVSLQSMDQITTFDDSLSALFELYQQYVTMGTVIAAGLAHIANAKDYSAALTMFLKYKQLFSTWRSNLMMNDHVLWRFQALDVLNFNSLMTSNSIKCLDVS